MRKPACPHTHTPFCFCLFFCFSLPYVCMSLGMGRMRIRATQRNRPLPLMSLLSFFFKFSGKRCLTADCYSFFCVLGSPTLKSAMTMMVMMMKCLPCFSFLFFSFFFLGFPDLCCAVYETFSYTTTTAAAEAHVHGA